MDALATPWANARAAHLLAIWRMVPVEVEDDRKEGYNTSQEGFIMHTRKVEILEPFSSHVIPIEMTEAYLGECLNVMVQSLHVQDGTLSPGLTVQNTYTELRKGSKKADGGSAKPHCLPPNSLEENSGGTNDTCAEAWYSLEQYIGLFQRIPSFYKINSTV